MNKFYTNEDHSVAGLILACKHRICRVTGKAWYSDSFIAWAKDVMRTFALEAWRLVKAIGQTLQEAYTQLKSGGGAGTKRIAYVPMGVTGKSLKKAPIKYQIA